MELFAKGFLLQASLILTLGAQNLFVIDVGLKKNNHLLAATICSICDVILIILGVLGVSAILVKTPSFKAFIGLTGALFLFYYAVLKFKEVVYGIKEESEKNKGQLTRKMVILSTLGFTLLNPHVYIDTFFLVGGFSTQYESIKEKLSFGIGAGAFSVIWFYFLAIFSSTFSELLTKERNLRVASLLTGMVLGYLAYPLGKESIIDLQKLF